MEDRQIIFIFQGVQIIVWFDQLFSSQNGLLASFVNGFLHLLKLFTFFLIPALTNSSDPILGAHTNTQLQHPMSEGGTWPPPSQEMC